MKFGITTLGVFTAAILCLPNLRAEGPIKLRPTWTPGKVYRQTQDVEMATKVPGIGDQKMQMSLSTSMKVTADGEEKLVTMTIDSIRMKVEMAGTEMNYDSTDEES